MENEIRNIGLLAHVDAGKTSLSENFLYLSGTTKSMGSVDTGTTQTDFLPVEFVKCGNPLTPDGAFELSLTIILLFEISSFNSFFAFTQCPQSGIE